MAIASELKDASTFKLIIVTNDLETLHLLFSA